MDGTSQEQTVEMDIKIDMRKRIVETSHGQATDPSVSQVGRGEATVLPAQIHSNGVKKGDITDKEASESRTELLKSLAYHSVVIPIIKLMQKLALCIVIGFVMLTVLGMVAISGTIAVMTIYKRGQMEIEDLVRYVIRIHMRRYIY